jgi:alpha-tubulin suppressor-like RCC1 family protein
MSKKDGRLIKINWDGNIISGQITDDLSHNIDEILSTCKENSGNKSRIMGEDSTDFNFEAAYDPAATYTFNDLLTAMLLKTSASVSFGEIRDTGTYYSCTGFITNLALTAPKNELTTFTGTFLSTGVLTQSDFPIMSFGDNQYGQLGMGTKTNYAGALKYPQLGKSSEHVKLGFHGIITFSDDTIKTFGRNDWGELMTGNETDYNGAIQTIDLSVAGKSIAKISCQANGTFILYDDDTMKCCGWNQIYGSLGVSNTTDVNGAIQTIDRAVGGKSISFMESGSEYTLLIYNDDTAVVWGRNDFGQIGTGNNTNYVGVPQTVDFSESGKSIIGMGCGTQHTVILFDDGYVKTFGYNALGQLGAGDVVDKLDVIQYIDMSESGKTVDFVRCGNDHSVIVYTDGYIKTFGYNGFGQLGKGNNTNYAGVPQLIDMTYGTATILDVICGANHTIIIYNNGYIKSFGKNTIGQLGAGDIVDKLDVVQTIDLDIKDVNNIIATASGDTNIIRYR